MRKTELTKEQQKKFKWLMEADTENENVEVSKFGHLIWKDGIWKNGTWEDGVWESGTWEGGEMWSNLKQKYIHVKWNKDKRKFKESLK